MSQTIQCPTCAKKFKLPERPPATFTCTGCQTVMDLSGFRAAPAAPAAAPEAQAAPSSPTSRKGSHGRAGSASARLKARARRTGGDEGEDDEEGGRGRGGAPKKDNNTLIIVSLIGFVVVVGIAFLVLRKKKDDPPKTVATTAGGVAAAEPTAPSTAPSTAPAAGMASAPATGAPSATGAEPGMEGDKPAEPPKFVPPSKVTFHPVEHHPDATPEEREKIDQLIQKAVFENAGADSRTAGHELVAIGMKAAPRLINVFSTVKMGEGFTDPMGRIKCAVAEALLRRIDGYIERSLSPKNPPIKGQSDPSWVDRCTRYWLSWWDSGKYQTPQKPWDERIDGNRDDAPDTGKGSPPGMGSQDTPDGGEK